VEAKGILVMRSNPGEMLIVRACPLFAQREEQDASHQQVASTRWHRAHIAAVVARRLVPEFMEREKIETVARRGFRVGCL